MFLYLINELINNEETSAATHIGNQKLIGLG